jgi:hypothetical protein
MGVASYRLDDVLRNAIPVSAPSGGQGMHVRLPEDMPLRCDDRCRR